MPVQVISLKLFHFIMDLICSSGEFKVPSTTLQKILSSAVLQIVQCIPFILNYLPFFFGLISFSLLRFFFLEYHYSEQYQSIYLAVLLLCLSEVLFFAYCLNSNKVLNDIGPTKRPYLSKKRRSELISMSAKSMLDSEHNFKGWLAMDTERMNTTDLNRNHLLDWIGWAVFGKSAIELEKEEIEEAEEYIVEAGLEKYLKVAPTKNQKTIRMFNQLPVPFQYIPLFAYIVVHLIKFLGGFMLKFMGFTHSSVNGVNNISYWIRQNNKSKEPPIIFCHGVGIGPVMYTLFIHKLTKLHPNRTIVVLQLDYLSMSLVEKPVSRANHLKFFDSVFKKHSFTKADWICHSFGSFVMSTVASQRASLVKNLTFIDPVCFNLLDPFLVYQVYNGPLTSISFQYILRYLVAYEFSVVRFFLRNFWWEEMVFFPDYLKNIKGQVKVYLSEDDLIVDHKTTTQFFNTYFNHDNFNYYTIKSAPHGGCIWNFSLMENLLNNLNY